MPRIQSVNALGYFSPGFVKILKPAFQIQNVSRLKLPIHLHEIQRKLRVLGFRFSFPIIADIVDSSFMKRD